ncbi:MULTISPECIES: NmrA/HSCARG family protein [unclassified Rhizobium]|uniref:NmrA/HSCARG family protein n=1 Tax=unclassified Rhizobium TaxID=2613769 RepID=UPI001C83B8CE|nr:MULTISPECIES: NmrA/HSCARG family protein [unclassified Rhizobium]MBX5166884.1 NmrA/HSCARG family protein [Rhizobium sp. NZLR4b]MBX5186287.1 NmrA/HSCARG family protein [Rhizobium sp. NZLR5]
MSIDEKPTIVVGGSLSKQGRSVTESLLGSGRYRVRALTSRTDSPAALKLAEQGAELIAVPLAINHRSDFVEAFRGAQGAFLMTPVVAPPATYEFDIGRDLADAAVGAGVDHIVFSTLENVDEITGGSKFAPHFTDKARVKAYIQSLPVRSSFVELAFFYTNLLEYYTPRKEGDTLVFPIYLPEHFRAPFVDPLTATGPAVLEIFDHPDIYAGQTLPIIGDILSPAEMIETFKRVTGRKAAYASAYTPDELVRHFPEFAKNPELVRENIGMAEYAVEYGYFRKDRDLWWSRRINPSSLTWEQFLIKTGWDGGKRAFGLSE